MSYARRSRFAGRSNEGRSILGRVSAAFQTVNTAARAAADKATAAAVTQDLDDELDISMCEPTPSKLPVRKFGGPVSSAVNAQGSASARQGTKAQPSKVKKATTSKDAKVKLPKPSKAISKNAAIARPRRARATRHSTDSAASVGSVDCSSPTSTTTPPSDSPSSITPPLLPSPVPASAASYRNSTGSVRSVASFLSCGSMGQLVTHEEESPAYSDSPAASAAGDASSRRTSSASSAGSVSTAASGSLGSPVDVLAMAACSMVVGGGKREVQRSRMSILRMPPPHATKYHPQRSSTAGGGGRASLSSSALRRLSVGMTAHVRHAAVHGPSSGTSGGGAGRVSLVAAPAAGAGGGSGGGYFPPPMPGAIALPGMAAAAAAAAACRHSALPEAATVASGRRSASGAGFVGRIARRLSVGTGARLPAPSSRTSTGGGFPGMRRGSMFAMHPPAPAIDEGEEEGGDGDEVGGGVGTSLPLEAVPGPTDDDCSDGANVSSAEGGDAGVNWMLLDAHMSLVMGSVFEWVPDAALLGAVGAVSHEWRRLATDAYSWRAAEVAVVPADTRGSLQVRSEEGSEVSFSLGAELLSPWVGFRTAFPWARFLAEGGFKKVYGVYFAPAGRLEAVSIMDMAGVVASGQADMVRAEVLTGCMVSQLARTGVTPGFVETYQVIPVAHAPPVQLWGSPEHKTPQGKFDPMHLCGTRSGGSKASRNNRKKNKPASLPKQPSTSGAYQLVRMELCRGGDVEEHLKGVEAAVAVVYASGDPALVQAAAAHDALSIAQSMFGVLQALCAAADRINMRHYDLKLLNILLKPSSDVAAEGAPGAAEVVHRYSTPHGRVAQLHMPCAAAPDALSPCQLECLVPKLVDFGTADMETDTLGQPVTLDHFTTFENVAPEMYWAGDDATQGYALDVWSLGLCLLHMLTGAMPYEETMAQVKCPDALRGALHAVWGGKHWAAPARPARGRKGAEYAPSPSYSVLRSCLEFDDEGVMPDTLWRAVVLCGLPVATEEWVAPDSNPVWLLLRGYCGDASVLGTAAAQTELPKASAKNSTLPKPRRTRGRPRKCPQPEPLSRDDRLEMLFPGCTESAGDFKRAQGWFSLAEGGAPLMARARARMDALPALRELLLGMLQWEPSARLDYTAALRNDAFTWMQEPRTRRGHRSAAAVPMRMRPVKHTQLVASAELGDVLVEDYTALAW